MNSCMVSERLPGRIVLVGMTRTLLLAVCLILSLSSSARADILELTPIGVEALKALNVAVTQHSNGKGYFIRGQIIVPRDDKTDLPTLRFPAKYFMFRPLQKGPDGRPVWGGSNDLRFEFRWVAGMTHEIDTLDDLRVIFSNRDKQYGDWQKAFGAILAEVDPTGSLGLKSGDDAAAAQSPSSTLKNREGWVSSFLIIGTGTATSSQEKPLVQVPRKPVPSKEETLRRGLALAKDEDPLGWNPIDFHLSGVTPDKTMGMLVEAIARMDEYGEPEKGLKEGCVAAAHFISDMLYIPPDRFNHLNGADDQTAKRIAYLQDVSRLTLFHHISPAEPSALAVLREERSNSNPKWKGDPFRYTEVDDDLPLNDFQMARAALKVVYRFERAVHTALPGGLANILLGCASARLSFNDYKAPSELQDLPPPALEDLENVAREAFDTLKHISKAPPEGRAGHGVGLRVAILRELGVGRGSHCGKPILYSKPRLRAASEAILETGVGSEEEVDLASSLVSEAIDLASYQEECPEREGTDFALTQIIYVLRQLTSNNAIDDRLLSLLNSKIDAQIGDIRVRRQNGGATSSERRFLEIWNQSGLSPPDLESTQR